jgi:hypothetical protein
MKCGIVFEKYYKLHAAADTDAKDDQEAGTANVTVLREASETGFLNLLLHTKPDINPFNFWGRVIVFLGIFAWGWTFIFTPITSPYLLQTNMHLINLPFHEAGHIFFRPFGQFISSLGGSLTQVLIPLICLAVLLLKTKDTFGASVTLWWTGQNFIDLAPYINDARALMMPLIGGNNGYFTPYGFHDWEFLLTETGLIQHDHTIASLSFVIGSALIILSFIWGGVLLYRQYRNIRSDM